MRILWLHQYFATPEGWGAVRTYEFARRFCAAGHAVDVVCCAGYDATLGGRVTQPLVLEGMRVFVSGAAYRPHMGFFLRVVSFLRFMAYALGFVVRRGRGYDILIASSGPLTMAVPALASHWLWRKPFVFEVIDVWPDSAIAAGVLKNPLLRWLSFRLESLAYRYAARILTCSTGMSARVAAKLRAQRDTFGPTPAGAHPDADKGARVMTLSNCCDLGPFSPDPVRRESTRARLGVSRDQVVALYTGAMGLSNEIPDLESAMRATADDARVVWWLAGDGRYAERLRRLAGECSGARTFFGTLPKREVVGLYLAADVNVITFMHSPLFEENSPNKFFDGIAAGLPAVFNRSTWLEPWLKEYDCGVVCPGVEPGREMAEALRGLADDPARRARMGRNARRLAEEVFDRDKLADEYLTVLKCAVPAHR